MDLEWPNGWDQSSRVEKVGGHHVLVAPKEIPAGIGPLTIPLSSAELLAGGRWDELGMLGLDGNAPSWQC